MWQLRLGQKCCTISTWFSWNTCFPDTTLGTGASGSQSPHCQKHKQDGEAAEHRHGGACPLKSPPIRHYEPFLRFCPSIWCTLIIVLEKPLESPWDCKEIKPVNPKGNQPWIFIGRTDAEASILWPPDAKSWIIGKDPDDRKDRRQEEKGVTEDEMIGWHHWLNGHEFEQTPGDGEGSLVCFSPWGRKESDTTERLNNNSNNSYLNLPGWGLDSNDLYLSFCAKHNSSCFVPLRFGGGLLSSNRWWYQLCSRHLAHLIFKRNLLTGYYSLHFTMGTEL